MTPRQRWLTLLDGGTPDRLPTDYWSTAEFMARLKNDLGLKADDDEALWRRLQIDHPRGLWPQCKRPHHPDDPQANHWGIRHRAIDYGTGSYQASARRCAATMDSASFKPGITSRSCCTARCAGWSRHMRTWW
jgi:hypothetical protein